MSIKYWLKCFFLYFIFVIKYPDVKFKEIFEDSELVKAYQLIEKIYVTEKKYMLQGEITRADLVDEFEDVSIKIGVFKGEEMIGFVRIIKPTKKGFYVDKDFNIVISDSIRHKAGEVSRFLIKDLYRDKLISFFFFHKVHEISHKNNIEYLILVTPEGLRRYIINKFSLYCIPLEQKNLTKSQLEVRKKMVNYYKIDNPSPYIIPLDQLFKF